ncbi:MAG TPA: hypothetical protein VGR56_02055 [Nitrososphaerales archaeon]|nr:hypothetical protein [Nitrososphaerales archaeon]
MDGGLLPTCPGKGPGVPCEKLYVTAPARTKTMMTGIAPSATGKTLSALALKV